MHDMTVRAAAWRAFMSGGARGTVDSVRTSHLMQEMVGQFFKGEMRGNVEHFEPFGYTSAVVSKTSSGVAEAFMNFLSGGKNHAVAGIISDRRYRLRGLLQGETAQHDDIGQATLLRRVGAFIVSLDGQGNADQETPGASNNNRMASLRHIQKDKQPTPKGNNNPFGSQQWSQVQDQNQQQAEQFKHEGEQKKVNSEVRVDAKGIHFYTTTKRVGYYQNSQSGQTPKWNWDVDQQGKTVVEYQLSQITHQSDNIQSVANDTHIVGASGTLHLHGNPIRQKKTILDADMASLPSSGSRSPDQRDDWSGDVIADNSHMTASYSSPVAPLDAAAGVPYDGFRWIDTTSGIEYSNYNGVWSEGGGAIAFPPAPNVGDVFSRGNRQWTWNGVGWEELKTKTVDQQLNVGGAVSVTLDHITLLSLQSDTVVTFVGGPGQFGNLTVYTNGHALSFANAVATNNRAAPWPAIVSFQVWFANQIYIG